MSDDVTAWLDDVAGALQYGPPDEADTATMVAALRAVLDMHQADPDEDVCNECWHLWPCGTVKTLTKALEGDE